MKRVIWIAQVAVLYLFTLVVSCVPRSQINRVGKFTGRLMSRAIPKRRNIAIDNIRRALPFLERQPHWHHAGIPPEELAGRMFAHLGTSLVETCLLYHGRCIDIIDAIEVRGREHFEQARQQHKGLIFITGHCGNWELLALGFSRLFNEPISVVARRQNNPYLNSMVEWMRRHYHNKVIYKQGALRAMMEVLKHDGLIGILADQTVVPQEGVIIEVLGRTAWAIKAPVIIARKTGAPVLPTFIHREADRHVITFRPPFELGNDTSEAGVQRDVQRLSRYVEEFIIAHPEDWYWVHRRWKRAGEPVP